MTLRCVALLTVLALLAACGSGQTASKSTPLPQMPLTVTGTGSFVAVRPVPGQRTSQSAVTVSDARTGRVSRAVLPDPWRGMQVQSTAVDAAGQVWVGLSSGPSCTGGFAGCGPKPRSCASEVITLDRATGAPHEVVKGTPDELISDAQPSPDGTLLAYLDGVCDRSYFNQYLRVQDLATGRSWTIGAGLPVCHSLGSIAWTPDGKKLVVDYGPSTEKGTPGPPAGFGTCSQPSPTELAVVPALEPSAELPGVIVAADRACQVAAVAATSHGYAAIEACHGSGDGPGDTLHGPAQLLRLDAALRITNRSTIGHCVNGAELRANATGTELLGTSYQLCAAAGNAHPRTITFTDAGHLPTTILDSPNSGEQIVRAISW
jgi:hypothetical protein